MHKKIVGIIGGHSKNTSKEATELSEKVGAVLASNGFAVMTGGEDGIMESVCRGAKLSGGVTLAISKGNKKSLVNDYVDYPICTSLDLAFMNVLVWTADCLIAFEGRYGTMSEIGLALDIGKPLIMIGSNPLVDTSRINKSNFRHIETLDKETDLEKLVEMVKKFMN